MEIMITDGPDGHCDGHEIITDIVWNRIRYMIKKYEDKKV